MRLLVFLFTLCSVSLAYGQDTYRTFKDTRVINTQSTETLKKHQLDVRIGHRFGDLSGDAGGWPTFYGLENASDVMIGVDYGFLDNLSLGLFRTKGSGPLKQLLTFNAKYKLAQQSDKTPVSVALVGMTSMSTMESSETAGAINNFEQFAHRLVFNGQLIVARKFSDRFAFQIVPSYTHRNIVDNLDVNGIFALGLAGRIQLTKVMGFIADLTLPFSDIRNADNGYYAPLGFGLEFDTGGHVFQINVTNSTGMMETDYVPYTRSSWGEGQFRLGFTISRLFNL